eukprot:scaffold117854_cov18-Prasinocladus_malaysianus.AAC.2
MPVLHSHSHDRHHQTGPNLTLWQFRTMTSESTSESTPQLPITLSLGAKSYISITLCPHRPLPNIYKAWQLGRHRLTCQEAWSQPPCFYDIAQATFRAKSKLATCSEYPSDTHKLTDAS